MEASERAMTDDAKPQYLMNAEQLRRLDALLSRLSRRNVERLRAVHEPRPAPVMKITRSEAEERFSGPSRAFDFGREMAQEACRTLLVPGLRELRRAMSWSHGVPVSSSSAARIQEQLATLVGETKRAAEDDFHRPPEPGELAAAARETLRVTVYGPPIRHDRPEVMVPPPWTLESLDGAATRVRVRSGARPGLWV